MTFAAVTIVTLAEGEINELHVELKSTMNALFLKDVAQKTRRVAGLSLSCGSGGLSTPIVAACFATLQSWRSYDAYRGRKINGSASHSIK